MAEKPLQSLTIQGLSGTYVNTPLSTAPVFDNTTAYVIGDYVFYNRKLYKFIANHAAGAWNSNEAVQVTIGNEIKQIENDKYEKPSGGIPASDLAQGVIPEVPVTDVQVNGTSILNQQTGVASITVSEVQTVTVTGTTPTITATQNTRYVCGEVATLDFTPSASGICDVIFTSGSTATVLTLPNTVILPSWFDATALEPNTTYEISISDGVYGAVMVW